VWGFGGDLGVGRPASDIAQKAVDWTEENCELMPERPKAMAGVIMTDMKGDHFEKRRVDLP
jgi:hypothetical protein